MKEQALCSSCTPARHTFWDGSRLVPRFAQRYKGSMAQSARERRSIQEHGKPSELSTALVRERMTLENVTALVIAQMQCA